MSPAPGRGEDKVHTSLTVAPAVGWGQTSGLTVAPPTRTSSSRQHRGSALQFGANAGLPQKTKWKSSPQKKLQEVATANELIKNDLSNVTEREFKIIVIKLIAGLENSIEDGRNLLLQRSREDRKSVV